MAHLVKRVLVRTLAIPLVLAVAVGSVLSLGGHTKPARAQQVAPADRAAVLTSLHAALSNGDLDGAMALFADNTVFIGAARAGSANAPCTQSTPCTDLAGIRRQLQNNAIGSHSCFTLPSLTVSGAIVTGQRESRNDSARKNGIERDVEDFFAVVPGSQITFFVALKNVGDPQTALDLAISAGTAQPLAPPIPTPNSCG